MTKSRDKLIITAYVRRKGSVDFLMKQYSQHRFIGKPKWTKPLVQYTQKIENKNDVKVINKHSKFHKNRNLMAKSIVYT